MGALARGWLRFMSGALAISGCACDAASGPGPDDVMTCPHAADGCSYYLTQRGDDHDSGQDPLHAWRSVARVNAQQLGPADRVLFEAGSAFSGQLTFDARDRGTADAAIEVASFGDGRATLLAAAGSGITLEDTAGFVIHDLILRGDWDSDAQSGNSGEGVSARNRAGGVRRSFLRLRNLEISGFKFAGIALHAEPADDSEQSGFEDVALEDCDVHDNGDVGVVSDGPFDAAASGYAHRSLSLRRLRVSNNRGLRHKGSHTGSGIVLSDVEGALIEDSVAFGNGEWNDHPSGGGFGIWAWDSTQVVIRRNESHDNHSATVDGGGFDLDGGVTHSVVELNYSHDNHGAGYGAFQFEGARPYADDVFRYNISQNDGDAVLIWDGNGDMGALDVYQNVGYGVRPALVTYSAVHAARVLNNVFFATGMPLIDVFDGAGLTLRGNDYWSGAQDFSARWNSGTAAPIELDAFETFAAATRAQGATDTEMNVDPQLVAAGSGPTLDDASQLSSLGMYKLQASSALIDHGIDLAELGIDSGGRDFFGSASPAGAGFDIGVNEVR